MEEGNHNALHFIDTKDFNTCDLPDIDFDVLIPFASLTEMQKIGEGENL